MERESSLPYSQVPATCPYPEPAPSSPHHHHHYPIPLPEDPSYYPPTYVWVSPIVQLSYGQLLKNIEGLTKKIFEPPAGPLERIQTQDPPNTNDSERRCSAQPAKKWQETKKHL
jgi:hypothetical protein